jgi:lipoprotein-anchoring transpeptidase ErfK/SrfK
LVLVCACNDDSSSSAELHSSRVPVPAETQSLGTAADPSPASTNTEARDEPKDAGKPAYAGPYLGALFLQTPVLADMEWPREDGKSRDGKQLRLGYLRHGGRVAVLPTPHKKSNCVEGWYELVDGGYVCAKYATLDANHPRFRAAPKAPDLNAPLPYQYGYNTVNGTPLYRQVPSREDRQKLEPWLTASKKRAKRLAERDRDDSDQEEGESGHVSGSDADDAGANQTPWFLRDYDGGKPMVTLDELKGEGPMARRMVKGFYLALDHSFGTANGMFWKTTGGLMAPYDKIWIQKPLTDFHGTWLGGAAVGNDKSDAGGGTVVTGATAAGIPAGRVGYVLSGRAKKYKVQKDERRATIIESAPRFTLVTLTGDSMRIAGGEYDETTDGYWIKKGDPIVLIKTGPMPEDLGAHEKWIDVDITRQTLVAFEGDTPVYVTLVSTGKRDRKNKEKDHVTPTGSYRIREKHIAATMDGDVATDGPYSIEDVPWIMYFNGSYALHGAFWHANFGHEQSHGCVNLSPEDARTLFNWTEPHLPDGWHGVNATPEHKGTRVVVHE